MGIYLNPNNDQYQELVNSTLMVDKSLLIEKINCRIKTKQKFVCVSRPRRFGKSTDANMLVAYYSKGCDSHKLFDSLKVVSTNNYEKHLNQHNVIHLNMQEFLSDSTSISDMLDILNQEVIYELSKEYDVHVITPNIKII